MTDQTLSLLLMPLVVIVPPLIGYIVGMRSNVPFRGAITSLIVSGITGALSGAAFALAVDLWAASMPGGNPWIGHSKGVTLIDIALGSAVGGASGTLSGILSGLVVWFRHHRPC